MNNNARRERYEKLIQQEYGIDLKTALQRVKNIYKKLHLEMAHGYENDAEYIYAVLQYPNLLERYAEQEEKCCATPELFVSLMLE